MFRDFLLICRVVLYKFGFVRLTENLFWFEGNERILSLGEILSLSFSFMLVRILEEGAWSVGDVGRGFAIPTPFGAAISFGADLQSTFPFKLKTTLAKCC